MDGNPQVNLPAKRKRGKMEQELGIGWQINSVKLMAELHILMDGVDRPLAAIDLTQLTQFYYLTAEALVSLAKMTQKARMGKGNLIESIEEFLRCGSSSKQNNMEAQGC